MSEEITLESRLDLTAARPLAQRLRDLTGDVVLNAGDVHHFGALCLQVVIAAARSRIALGHGLTLTNIPDRVLGQLSHMGVTPEMIEKGLQ